MSVPDIRRPGRAARPLWDPWAEFDDMFQRMGRLMTSLMGEPGRPLAPGAGGWTPRVDVEETDDAYLVEAELPGVSPEDVSVEVDEGRLRIHGEISEQEHKDHEHRTTRRTGRFDYELALPSDADADNVQADLANGLLTVRAPKSTETRRRRVPIGGGGSQPAIEPR